jgi:hypothetical protein
MQVIDEAMGSRFYWNTCEHLELPSTAEAGDWRLSELASVEGYYLEFWKVSGKNLDGTEWLSQ